MNYLAPIIPLTNLCISIAIYALALDARSKRWIWLAPLLCFQYLALATTDQWPNNGIDSLWGLLVCIWISHSISVLLLEDRDLLVDTIWAAGKRPWYWQAWMTWNNPRLLGISREERHTPRPFLGQHSLAIFTFVRSGKVAAYLLASTYVQPLIIPGAFMPFLATDFDEIRQTYFRRILLEPESITARETTLRAVFAIFWAWGAYAMVDGAHSALSVVFVSILRVDQPNQWPPIFGSMRDTQSLRKFWGAFWHRLVVLPYSNYGKFIAERAFGFRPGSSPHKLLVAFTIFFISGVAHAVVAWQLGDQCGWHLDIWWFCLNFVASAAESIVGSKFLRSSGKPQTGPNRRLATHLRTCCGYGWVYAFFFWSVPKWQYPKVQCLFTGA